MNIRRQGHKCPDCDGYGHVDDYCTVCNSTGEGMVEGTMCKACKGRGEWHVLCDSCEGTGELLGSNEYTNE